MSRYIDVVKIAAGNEEFGGKTVPMSAASYGYYQDLFAAVKRIAYSAAIKVTDACQRYADGVTLAETVYHSIRYDRPQAGKNDSFGNPPSTPELALWTKEKYEAAFRGDLVAPMTAIKIYMALADTTNTMFGSYKGAADLAAILRFALESGMVPSEPFQHPEKMPPRIARKVRKFNANGRVAELIVRCGISGKGTITFPLLSDEEIESLKALREISDYDRFVVRFLSENPLGMDCDNDLIQGGYVTSVVETTHGKHYYITKDMSNALQRAYIGWPANSWLFTVCHDYERGMDTDELASKATYLIRESVNGMDLVSRAMYGHISQSATQAAELF